MSEDERRSQAGSVPGAPDASGPDASGALSAICRRVVAWYAAAATTWIVASDAAFGVLGEESPGHVAADIAKGSTFVAVSAVALWIVLRRLTQAYDRHFAREVTAQRDFYESLVRASSDLVLIFDATGTIRYANDAVTDTLGWTAEDLVGRSGRSLLHPGDRSAADSFRENAPLGSPARRTFRMLRQDGTYRALEIAQFEITLADGEPGAVVNGRDVTERMRGEQQLRAALAADATGLPNLRMFVAEMERLASVSIVGLEAVVLLVDIDRFGDINALHGRAGGDAVLLELTRRLESTLPDAIGLWRHGADEILVVLLDSPYQDEPGPVIDVTSLVERVQQEAAAPLALDDSERRVSVSVSVGVARVPVSRDPGAEPLGPRMLRSVELALAEAKQHPDRSAVHVHHDAVAPGARAQVVAQLHEAVERRELVAHFQPKVRLADLAVVGAEALVRWEHPERGMLPPGDFLRSVEEANLTATLTRIVLGESLSQAQGWIDSVGCDADFEVSVNVTLDDLRRKRFVHGVFDALEASGVEPQHLCLELTEQTMLADAHGASTVVAELRRAGIRVAIDDFGTGYSSLEHIRVFEVDALKIDKGFVQRIGRSRTDEAIVDSIIAIGDRLGITVIAEGIEDVRALEYLRDRGCDHGQGFLFSPAVPAAEFAPCQTWASLPG